MAACTHISLFSGAGGLDLGLRIAIRNLVTVCYVERDAYAAACLVARMEDETLDSAPVWDDISTFDGRAWRGLVDIVSGGFPCQDLSVAGKRAGIDGERSGLWSEMARIVGEVRPRFVFIENVPGLLADEPMRRVLGDLSTLGFDAEWLCLGAGDVGAPHRRERVFVLAYTNGKGLEGIHDSGWGEHLQSTTCVVWGEWDSEPAVDRVASRLAYRNDRLRLCGNGVVPLQAAVAFTELFRRLT